MAGEFGIQRKWKAFEDLRRRIRALEERRKAVDMSPADPRLRLRLGDAFRGIGRLDDALGQYREAALLFERLGFRRHAHAARILILRIRPDDVAALRDLRFTTNLELARGQAPLPRELRALPPREGFGPVLALPETIADRSHHPRSEEEKAAAAEAMALAGERAAPSAPPASLEKRLDPILDPPAKRKSSSLSSRIKPKLRAFELLLGDDADGRAVEIPDPVPVPPASKQNGHADGRVISASGDNRAERAWRREEDALIVDVDVSEPVPPLVKGRPRPKDRRSDPRVDAEGEVRIFRGADALGRLEDVSESGLFIAGPRLDAGSVLDVVIRLPDLDWLGLARVRVARNVPATKRRAAGVGLEILWTDTPTERWIEEFVARSFGVDVLSLSDGGDPRKMLDESRRVFARTSVSVPIALSSADFEVAGWAMDLSMGGAFVQAPRVYSAGRRVEAVIWLPGVNAPLRIPSVVANARTEGTGIRFIRLTELQEELLASAL